MRKAGAFVLLAAICACAYAGDVANFVELGFSPNGKIYAFGQHGTEDKTFSAYADIFFVDVAKNEFVPGANLSLAPGETSGATSSDIFKQLKKKAALSMKRLGVDSGEASRPIYTEAAHAPHSDGLELSFRDFETGKNYDVTLHQRRSGSGDKPSSSFYITAKITDPDGKETSFTVGNPGRKRQDVLGYRISRILTDQTGSALVFVVEKEMRAPNGTSVRYMVETVHL